MMSSSDASYVSSSDSEDAETEVEYDLEVEGFSNPSEHETSDDEPGDAYANEPIADEEWLAQYEEERKTEEELENKLQNRLNGAKDIKEWLVDLYCFVLLATRHLRVYGCPVTYILIELLIFASLHCKFSSVFYCLGVIVANAALHVCKTSVNAIAVAS